LNITLTLNDDQSISVRRSQFHLSEVVRPEERDDVGESPTHLHYDRLRAMLGEKRSGTFEVRPLIPVVIAFDPSTPDLIFVSQPPSTLRHGIVRNSNERSPAGHLSFEQLKEPGDGPHYVERHY
jgi:hypothetical protein